MVVSLSNKIVINMNKIPTAEEFWSEIISSDKEFSMLRLLRSTGLAKHVFEAMRRFTRLHVEEALKMAYFNHEINTINGHNEDICEVDKDSILNAYPLENIK